MMIMRHLQTTHRNFFLALLLVAACAASASAQAGGPYEITKPTIAAGSNTSAGGNYVIIGTMGQHDAVVMGGGPYLFDGGFWPEEQGFTPPPCATDVTAQLKINDGGFKIRDGDFHVDSTSGRFVQTVKITNVSNSNIRGPLSFVLDGLSRNVTLVNQIGTTFCALPASPYVLLDLGSDGILAPREKVTLELEFTSGNRRDIRYNARVLAGISR
jgi:hypothetical protein